MSSPKMIYNYRGYAFEFDRAMTGMVGWNVVTSDGSIGKIAKIGAVWKIARRQGDGKSRLPYDSRLLAAQALIDEHIPEGVGV